MKKYKRCVLFSIYCGLIYAVCTCLGIYVENLGKQTSWINLFGISCISVVFINFILWTVGIRLWRRVLEKSKELKLIRFLRDNKDYSFPFVINVVLLLFMWLPVWLSIFPGAFAYDAYDEWMQVRNNMVSSHHPVLHVLLVGYCLEIAYALWGSYNIGIIIYTFIQMVLLACIFSYALRFFKSYGLPVWARGFMLLFWGGTPTVQLFAVSVTKDTLFAGMFLLFLLMLIDIKCREELFWKNKGKKSLFIMSALGTMILRNNGFYVVLIVLIIMCIMLRKCWKHFLPLVAVIAGVYWLYVGPFYNILGVQQGGIQEMFSVPLQQMARVYTYSYEELDSTDIAKLEKLIPREDLESYRPKVADFVKTNFNAEVFNADKLGYLKLWIKWGVEHPMTYVNAFLIMTEDYWHPWATVDGYEWGDGDTDYFDYSVNQPGERVEIWPQAYEYYRNLSKDWNTAQKPLVKLLMNPGVYFLIFIYTGMVFWYIRESRFWLSWIAVALAWLTVLLGPVALVRYVLILYFAIPIWGWMIIRGMKNKVE